VTDHAPLAVAFDVITRGPNEIRPQDRIRHLDAERHTHKGGPNEIRPQDRIRHLDAERHTRKGSPLTSHHLVSTATLNTRGWGDNISHEVSSVNPKRPLLPSRAQQTYDQEMAIFRKKHST
jgi:hypothetical protein